jgi:hypothetical protein
MSERLKRRVRGCESLEPEGRKNNGSTTVCAPLLSPLLAHRMATNIRRRRRGRGGGGNEERKKGKDNGSVDHKHFGFLFPSIHSVPAMASLAMASVSEGEDDDVLRRSPRMARRIVNASSLSEIGLS